MRGVGLTYRPVRLEPLRLSEEEEVAFEGPISTYGVMIIIMGLFVTPEAYHPVASGIVDAEALRLGIHCLRIH